MRRTMIWLVATVAMVGLAGCPDDGDNGGGADVITGQDGTIDDTGGGDIGTTDTGTADTGTADTGTTDTMADTGTDDTGTADTMADTGGGEPKDPATAPRATIDRFSAEAGTLMVRDETNGLPAAGAAINMDMAPFVTQGLGPAGEVARYYNFDVQSDDPAPIYVLFETGAADPVAGQLNIVDVIPGDDGYSDFWHPQRVDVPVGYVANTVTSLAEIQAAGWTMTPLDVLVNCPVVPDGSTANMTWGSADTQGLTMGWYKGEVVFYFSFEEAPLAPAAGKVPTSPIYVTFNTNGEPSTGFVVEDGTSQTHNVLGTLPGQAGYSPLWSVNVYDNADFDTVSDITSAATANILAMGVANVNCPVGKADLAPKDPATAPRATIDRFSADAGTLFVRDETNGLPAAGVPIDMDMAPFVTQGLGPAGQVVHYYNFDVQALAPAPIYVLFREGEDSPVAGQLNIVDVIPGDAGYNDFWHPQRVTAPADYVANTVTSAAQLMATGWTVTPLDALVNCPVVPEGSTATMKMGSAEPQALTMGWYKDQVVTYFSFEEAPLAPAAGEVPTSPIYVTFNTNGEPSTGFVVEPGTSQTHNVLATLPGMAAYSPLWDVNVYDNADFDAVSDLATAAASNILAAGVADVNCPVVNVAQ